MQRLSSAPASGKNLGKFIAGTFGIPAREQAILVESISDAVAAAVPIAQKKMKELPAFGDIGKRTLLSWQENVTGLRDSHVYAADDWPAGKVIEGISDLLRLPNPPGGN